MMVVSPLNIALVLLGTFSACLVFAYFYFTRNFNYWKKMGIPYEQPNAIGGNLGKVLFQRIDIARYLKDLYLKNKGKPYVGFFSFDLPCLLINDLELVKDVLVKEFQYFTDRNVNVNSQIDPMFGRTMFSLKGQKWRHVRVYLTPVFTTGKMKSMFHLVEKNFGYWKKLGVPYVKPRAIVGNFGQVLIQKVDMTTHLKQLYLQTRDKPYVGIYSFDRPSLLVNDLDITKNMLVKDFQHFTDRNPNISQELDPMFARTMFSLKGHEWKHVRMHITPIFSSGKLKSMFNLVEKCAEDLDTYLENALRKDSNLDVKETMARYTTDSITNCAFGLESNALKNEDSEIRRYLKTFVEYDVIKGVATLFLFFCPYLQNLFKLRFVDIPTTNFLRRTVWGAVDHREKTGLNRKDFIDHMMELRKKNDIEGDTFVAQSFGFFFAGFETSASTLTYTLYELAKHPEIQTRLREEIMDSLAENDNKISDYELPAPDGKGTVTIKAGTSIYIPLLGIQMDPEYYPDPEKYDPERFTEENKQNRHNFSYMPFGEGPRICIGMRFGLMQVKTGLVHVLSRYEVAPCKDTPIPMEYDTRSFLISSVGDVPLHFKKLVTKQITQELAVDFGLTLNRDWNIRRHTCIIHRMWLLWTLLIVVLAILTAVFLFFIRHFNHWMKNGVPYEHPLPFLGNFKDVVFRNKNIGLYLKDLYENHKGAPVPINDVTTSYVREVVTSWVLGTDSNSFDDQRLQKLKNVFQLSWPRLLGNILAFCSPEFINILGIRQMQPELEDFMRDLIWRTVKSRDDSGTGPKDFLDSLMEIRKICRHAAGAQDFNLEGDDFVAQSLSAIIGGTLTSSSTMTIALYELALHPEIQCKLRTEIYETLERHNKELTFEAIHEMKYLDMVVHGEHVI
ncbi:hypothetical protein C0J52_26972 [Blattella germanica]|nr:hypothetical protein C0J52_26972 [Blattella germanica]